MVWVPLGPNRHVDLIAEVQDRLLRVQVKTSTCRRPTGRGERWEVSLRTRGGNRSWSGTSKRFDRDGVDYLFVLAGDGRRWLVPASAVEGTAVIRLGGQKYSEFEVESGTAIGGTIHEAPSSIRLSPASPWGSARAVKWT